MGRSDAAMASEDVCVSCLAMINAITNEVLNYTNVKMFYPQAILISWVNCNIVCLHGK